MITVDFCENRQIDGKFTTSIHGHIVFIRYRTCDKNFHPIVTNDYFTIATNLVLHCVIKSNRLIIYNYAT